MGYSYKLLISSSKYKQSLLLPFILTYSLLLIIPFALSIQDYELAYSCSATSDPYAPGSNYSQSLLYLVDDLCFNAPLNNGFRSASRAEGPDDPAYGLALCRGDVSPKDCEICLTNATIAVANTYCLYSRGAIIVRQFCLLKYSNVDFRGEVDSEIYYSTKGLDYPYNTTLGVAAVGLLSNLSETAVGAPDKFFASGTKATENKTLYGMVQCTRDISAVDCGECLNDAISGLLSWCMNEVGAHVVYGSCRIRYQLYPFLY